MKRAFDLGPVNKRTARGHQRLYRLDPPMVEHSWDSDDASDVLHEYVVVSATNAFGIVNETYIFPSDDKGEITKWIELDGSFRGGQDHKLALANAGYTVMSDLYREPPTGGEA